MSGCINANPSVSLDLTESVENRDVVFETERLKSLFSTYLHSFIDRMNEMETDSSFVRDDSYHSVHSSHHIMYKLNVDTLGNTMLVSSDGLRGYEFLVEFDKDDPAYGIYYGCRGLIFGGDQGEQIDIFDREWQENLKYVVCKVLNDTFVDMDFSKRFQMTNNANNKTYWPFWISLGVEEDIIQVAARAMKLIFNIYQMYLSGNLIPETIKTKDKAKSFETRYTENAYNSAIKKYCKKAESKRIFEKFIRGAVKYHVIEQDFRYEKCYKFVSISNAVLGYMLSQLCVNMGLSKSEKDKIVWSLFIPIFVSHTGESLDSIRKSHHNSREIANTDTSDQHKKTASMLLSKCL